MNIVPLEQGRELSSAENSTSRWVYIFIQASDLEFLASHAGLRDYEAYCVLYAVSPRVLPWQFLPQHLPLAVLTEGKKPELVLLLPWMTNTGREGLGTRLSASYLVSRSITQVCSGHTGLYKAYPCISVSVGRAAVARSMHDLDC